MAGFVGPRRSRLPETVVIREDRLWAPPSERGLTFPPPGAWRSFAESDPTDIVQIAAIARRFGGLTPDAVTPGGERLWDWNQLVSDLQYLSNAWTDTGALNEPLAVSDARMAANQMQGIILAEHQRRGGDWAVGSWEGGSSWVLCCTAMGPWWRLTAIEDVRRGAPMRRCRHCATWFSLGDMRSDAGFCSAAHRSAFYQKRQPTSRFWAEVI